MKFHKSEETLNIIKDKIKNKQKGAYLRFGDGDVNLALGKSELLQETKQKLTDEMREAFTIEDENVLKTLPLYCKEYDGWEEGMFPGNHEAPKEWCDNIINQVKEFWIPKNVYSHVALHFLSTTKPEFSIEFLRFLKEKKPICIVGNKNISKNVIEKLFGDKCVHIKTPERNSYYEIDRIETECQDVINKNKNEFNIIITSMGCSGRVLQKRLYKHNENVFLFDFGSLMDAFCGEKTRAWIELTNFDGINFLNKI
jgi:hypothetical protein